jgi:hypothetical protein
LRLLEFNYIQVEDNTFGTFRLLEYNYIQVEDNTFGTFRFIPYHFRNFKFISCEG